MPNYSEIPLGWPYPKRKRLLEELTKQQPKYEHVFRFQGKVTKFGVFTVEIGMPKYRLWNGRTQAAQEEIRRREPRRAVQDFFTRDPELTDAQRVQHELLKKLVDNTPLRAYFRDPRNSQEQPLIVTDKGFVVNGNRRLCALRELYCEGPQTFSRYSHVDLVVLPVCSDKDIDELEAYLQIQPDIKEDYTWIAKACMLRAKQERHKYTDKDLALLYGMDEKEVQKAFSQLTLVDEYLSERGKAKQYDLVGQDEFAFGKMVQGRQQIKQPDEKDAFTELTYCLVDDPSAAGGRLYQIIPEVKEHLQAVLDRLVLTMELPVPPAVGTPGMELLGPATEPTHAGAIARVLANADAETRASVVEDIVDVIQGKRELKKQRKKANAVLLEVTLAHTNLTNALNSITESTAHEGIAEQLNAVEHLVAELRARLSSMLELKSSQRHPGSPGRVSRCRLRVVGNPAGVRGGRPRTHIDRALQRVTAAMGFSRVPQVIGLHTSEIRCCPGSPLRHRTVPQNRRDTGSLIQERGELCSREFRGLNLQASGRGLHQKVDIRAIQERLSPVPPSSGGDLLRPGCREDDGSTRSVLLLEDWTFSPSCCLPKERLCDMGGAALPLHFPDTE